MASWRVHGASNADLVAKLVSEGMIKSEKVKAAMLAVDRAHYVPDDADPYEDSPQYIGHGATISAPHMHATAMEALIGHLKPGARVLDVGSGTGILLAVMAPLVQPGGKVCGVEHIAALVEQSLVNMRKDSATAAAVADGTILVKAGDGYAGWAEHGPFDAIHVGAAAPEIPSALVAQLAKGGRMIVPVGKYAQDLVQVDKDASGHVSVKELMGVRFVPLTTVSKQLGHGFLGTTAMA